MTKPGPSGRTKKPIVPVSKKHQSKYKKKNTSTFGPIAVLPKSNKWSLTASMGGTTTNKRRPKKQENSSKYSRTFSRPEKPKQQQNRWTLQMPVVSSTAPSAPWIPSQRTDSADLSSNKMHKVLPAFSLPVASLEKLQAELLDFASYVRLSEPEIASRLQVVKEVQLQCHHLFGVSLDSIKVFGSFACLDVCTFASDVDLAIHDVVHVPSTSISQHAAAVDDIDENATPKRATKRQKSDGIAVNPNQKRQERILEWKTLLEEAEAHQQKKVTEQEQDVKQPASSKSGQPSAPPLLAPVYERLTEGTKFTSRQTRVEIAAVQSLPLTAVRNDEGIALFVIDSDGCPDDKEVKPTEDPATVTDTSRGSSIFEEEDEENKEEESPPSGNIRLVSNVDGTIKELNESEGTLSANEMSDSDDDSADKLASLKERERQATSQHPVDSMSVRAISKVGEQEVIEIDDDEDDEHDLDEDEDDEPLKVETRPRSRSLISLCSATTCSDNEEREWDESGMEVSFVSNGKSKSTVPELSEEMRVKVIRALNALGRRLRGCLPLHHLHVRKKARVPIINLQTRYGYECDIAVGGHQGMDTSGYAVAQCRRFQR